MSIESRVQFFGKRLLDLLDKRQEEAAQNWLDTLISRTLQDERFRVQVLRFVDVLPALHNDSVLAQHLREYFGELDLPLPDIAAWGVRHSESAWAVHVAGPLVRASLRGMSRRFMGGQTARQALNTVTRLRKQGMNFTLDRLGEATVSETEAGHYQADYLDLVSGLCEPVKQWVRDPLLDECNGRSSPRMNISVKLSSLYSQINPLDPDGSVSAIAERLRPVLRRIREAGGSVTIDMEQYEFRHIVLQCFQQVFMEEEFRDWADTGLAIQTYLRESYHDLQQLIEWCERRGTPVTVRLVRGAYWDYETIIARQQGWQVPVWEQKSATDACFERCLGLLLDTWPGVEVAVATHNVRSLACTMAFAEDRGITPGQFEFQMLYGMADPLKAVLVELGYRLRVYVPYGETLPGMAYLVRRLLENSSGETILDSGLAGVMREVSLEKPVVSAQEPESDDCPVFRNTAVRRFTGAGERQRFAEAISAVREQLGKDYRLRIDGESIPGEDTIESVNPAHPGEVIGKVAAATREHADAALVAARNALPKWRELPARERAGYLRAAAKELDGQRDSFAAWQILEAGKSWREADADVCEAIDFLNYYADQAERLAVPRVVEVPGENNRYEYRPKGVGLVIAPWNFPLAILTGMLSATVVCGNTAIVKPSSLTPVIAARFVDLLHRVGLPQGVVNYLPGAGATVGEYLATRPGVSLVAFTGSQAVGTRLIELGARIQPGQVQVRRVIAEMGGKNALIIDADADFDVAVPGTLQSAFSYQGQKCSAASRVIVVGGIHDAFVERLIDATRSLIMGDPQDPACFMGPVIDEVSRKRILGVIQAGRDTARLAMFDNIGGPGDGFYVSPAIFTDVDPDHTLAQDEIFGPVLSVIRASDFEEALAIANNTRYGLTGGVYSRQPAHLQRAREAFSVGNLYLNRKITGALVSRQPFGGSKMSGVGSKAGGEVYLLQFMDSICVTENTLRRGFAPGSGGDTTG